MEAGKVDPASGRITDQKNSQKSAGKTEREHSQQIDIRSVVLQKEDLPLFEATEVDPLRVFMRRVYPRLRAVLSTYGDSGEELEEVLRQAILTLSTQRRELDSQDTWTAGALHLKSMLYWRKRQRGVGEAVDRTLAEMVSDPSAPRDLKRATRACLERWVQDLPPRCRNRLRMRYGLAVDTDQIAQKLGRSRRSVRKITSRCIQTLALAILDECLAEGAAGDQ
jgi:RNA polymerase sigma factor (sigma-70 family)